MSLPRFILSPSAFQTPQVSLSGPELQHARVLRLKVGDPVQVGDGEGREWTGKITRWSSQAIEIGHLEPFCGHTEPKVQVTLFQGLLRGAKMELILQKTTELGLARFVPMLTSRSQAYLHEAAPAKIKRWQEIARQAVRQSERACVPELSQSLTFTQALAEARAADLAIIPYEQADPQSGWKQKLQDRTGISRVYLYIGPEGGFTEAEAQQAQDAGLIQVGLGPRILRAETAGVTAVALALYQWGDLGGLWT